MSSTPAAVVRHVDFEPNVIAKVDGQKVEGPKYRDSILRGTVPGLHLAGIHAVVVKVSEWNSGGITTHEFQATAELDSDQMTKFIPTGPISTHSVEYDLKSPGGL